MTMHKALHPKSNVDRLYISRNEGGRGLISVEDTIETSKIGLERHVQESKERLLSAAKRSEIEVKEKVKQYKDRRAKERKENWKEKVLHGQFIRQTEEIAGEERWKWLKNSGIKRETETLILAAQELAIRTNLIKARIEKHRRTVDVECAVRLMKLLIISSANAAKWRRKNTRIDMIESGEESTGTYAGSLGYM